MQHGGKWRGRFVVVKEASTSVAAVRVMDDVWRTAMTSNQATTAANHPGHPTTTPAPPLRPTHRIDITLRQQ